MTYYKAKYKAVKIGKEDTMARNKKEAIKNIKSKIKTHIQGNVKVQVYDVKEFK